jgi:hypothetical protein
MIYNGSPVSFGINPRMNEFTSYRDLSARFDVSGSTLTNIDFHSGNNDFGFGLVGNAITIGGDSVCVSGCRGTGQFVLVDSVPLDEPGNLLMFGLGLVASATFRMRRRYR